MTYQLDLETPADEPVIRYRRFVKAPPALLFQAYTDPEHMKNWLGPRYLEMVLCEVDLRVGGRWRFVHRAPDGTEHAFHGVYREVDRPNRLSNTFVYEPWPDAESVDTVEFAEAEGGTLVVGTSRHSSIEARDRHLASGMEKGIAEGCERLDELVAALQSS
ncbi:MAG TPA: SRPBCC family protein [Actinocrinis sp.]|nr:SRPBCC family protein [Actinocrinis sp.]